MSSIGTVGNLSSKHPGESTPEVALADPSIPIGQGYSESKWITESLLDAARNKSGDRSVVEEWGRLLVRLRGVRMESGIDRNGYLRFVFPSPSLWPSAFLFPPFPPFKLQV
jgi:hypothetical protein